jgi:DNA-binding transcriptional LysR family regulator
MHSAPQRAVEIGAGVSPLPGPTVTREVEAGTLVKVPLEDDTLVRPLGIVHRRGKKLTITAERFRDALTASDAINTNVFETPEAVGRSIHTSGAPVAASKGRLPR